MNFLNMILLRLDKKNINVNFIKKLKPKSFLLFSLYVLTLAVFVVTALFNFFSISVFGDETKTLTLNDFSAVNVEVTGDMSAVATSNDPQLIYNGDISEVQSISYTLISGGNGVVCAYYTTQSGADFSNHMRLFPAFGEVQNVQYVLPQQSLTALRLDIGSIAGESFVFEQINLNPKIPFWAYFVPSTTQVVLGVVLPLLFYAVLLFIIDVLVSFKTILKKKGNDEKTNIQ